MMEMERDVSGRTPMRCRTNHGTTYELLLLSLVLDLDDGLSGLVNDLVRPVLHVGLNIGVRELSSNESLGVEDGVVGVHGDLVLGGITDETLRVVESDVRGGGSVTLVVGDNLDTVNGERPLEVSLKGIVDVLAAAHG